MDGLLHDLRLALRGLLRAPLATGLAVVCLALGIGTNATMFSVVNSLLLKALPFREPAQLVTVWSTQPAGGVNRSGTSYLDLVDYQEQSRAFEALVGVESRSLTFSDTDEPERVVGAAVGWRLFSMLGIAPALGRDFAANDDQRRGGQRRDAQRRAVASAIQRRSAHRGPGRDHQRAALHRDRRAPTQGEVPVLAGGVDSAGAAQPGRTSPGTRSRSVRAHRKG